METQTVVTSRITCFHILFWHEYIARCLKRLRVDEGRNSYDEVELELMGVDARDLLGKGLECCGGGSGNGNQVGMF